jgi:uncharacterized protein YbbK (DUF523 family)
MKKILISACLLGRPVRYDGRRVPLHAPQLERWHQENILVPFCAEVAGGLGIPRPSAEIAGGEGGDVLEHRARVVNIEGKDVTAAFLAGAEQALELALREQVCCAILKQNSPSCGSRRIYDGTFSKSKRDGRGVCAALLEAHGIQVFDETELALADEYLRRTED